MADSFEESNLQNLLEQVARDEGFKHPRYSIESATKPGENFIGRVFRVVVNEENDAKSLRLIVKASSANRARQELLSSNILFRTERDAYETVLPTLNTFLKKRGLSDTSLFPGTVRCFGCDVSDGSRDKADVIILEDKKAQGYGIVDIKPGLNEIECRLALEKLALLHASFMALHEIEPESFDELRRTISKNPWEDENHPLSVDLKQGLLNGLGYLEEQFKEGHRVYDRLSNIYKDFHKQFMKLWVSPTNLPSISHGDFWSNNVLFKLNANGLAEDAYIIDFQLVGTASPVIDVSMLLLLCTTKELRDEHYDSLLRFYHNEISKSLTALGCEPEKIFSWELFEKHLRQYSVFGVASAVLSLPVLMADKSDIKTDTHSESENIFCGTAMIKNPENRKVVTKRLNDVVLDAARWGYI